MLTGKPPFEVPLPGQDARCRVISVEKRLTDVVRHWNMSMSPEVRYLASRYLRFRNVSFVCVRDDVSQIHHQTRTHTLLLEVLVFAVTGLLVHTHFRVCSDQQRENGVGVTVPYLSLLSCLLLRVLSVPVLQAVDLIQSCLLYEPSQRPAIDQLRAHPWLWLNS